MPTEGSDKLRRGHTMYTVLDIVPLRYWLLIFAIYGALFGVMLHAL